MMLKSLVAVLVCALVATRGYEYTEVMTSGTYSVSMTVNTTHILLRGTLPPKTPGGVKPITSLKLPLLYNQIVVNNITVNGNTYFPFMDLYCVQPLSKYTTTEMQNIVSLNWMQTNGTVHCTHQLAQWQVDVRNAGNVAKEIDVAISVEFLYMTTEDDDGTNSTSAYCKKMRKLHHKHHHHKFGCFFGGMLTMAIGVCLVRCVVRCCQRRRAQRMVLSQEPVLYATPLLPPHVMAGYVPYVSQKYGYPTMQSNVITT